jgi:hypothetical protein
LFYYWWAFYWLLVAEVLRHLLFTHFFKTT